MPSVTIRQTNLPDDAEVEIPDLGVFANHTTTEVDEDDWTRYKTLHPDASDEDIVIDSGAVIAQAEETASIADEFEDHVFSDSDNRATLDKGAQVFVPGYDPSNYSTKADVLDALEDAGAPVEEGNDA